MTQDVRSRGHGYVLVPVLLLVCGTATYPARAQLPDLVRGTFADTLWAAAFSYVLAALTQRDRTWVLAGIVIALALELSQGCSTLPGTFDRADLVALSLGYALGLALERSSSHRGSCPVDMMRNPAR